MDNKKYLKLNDIEAYKKAFILSNQVWELVMTWEYFAKDTVGKQLVRAIDSISANIAEGFGRYHKKEKVLFYRYAKSSAYECFDWCEKARVRQLFNQSQYTQVYGELKEFPRLINQLIKFTNEKLQV